MVNTACTDPNQGSHVPSEIENRYLELASSICAARTMLHEAIHAHLIYYLKVVQQVEGINWESFPDLWKYVENSNSISQWQHNNMADLYRGVIENGLREFAKMNGQSFSNQFYSDMAWGGLYSTKSFNKLRTQDRVRIQDTIDDQENAGGCQ